MESLTTTPRAVTRPQAFEGGGKSVATIEQAGLVRVSAIFPPKLLQCLCQLGLVGMRWCQPT